MDCPYLIYVPPIPEDDMVTVRHHLKWLKEQNIIRFRWSWAVDSTEINRSKWQKNIHDLRFRFEKEEDKAYFALRWA